MIDRREFLGAVGAAAGSALLAAESAAGETLYNGVRLSSPWPPKVVLDGGPPATPPYLKAPPDVIPIDVGRQLFVDDFLVARTTLTRTFHAPRPHPASPLLRPETQWEKKGKAGMAMVFSDGVWYDPHDRLFKMWYMGGYQRSTCYAFSEDGVRWTRPRLDVRPGTNIVQPDVRDSATVWLDLGEKDPARRYKFFRAHGEGPDGRFGLSVYFSADGIHWGRRVLRTGSTGDRTTVFWNPFRKVWVYSIRHGWGRPRQRRYWEVRDILAGPQWTGISEPPLWAGADRLDPERADLQTPCELYNLDCVAYESLLLGMFTIWRGDKNIPPGRPKPNEVCLGFSRDGFHWSRPDRRPFLAVSERRGDWNWGNVQSAGGCCLVVGDDLYIYHSGRSGSPGKGKLRDGSGSTGLAVLRRDGFASLDAGPGGGTLTTRPVRFSGKHLFANVAAGSGGLTAEVLDERGRPVAGLAGGDCVPVRGDGTRLVVKWKAADLGAVVGRAVRFRFHLKDGRLYSFWVSPDKSGASRGYVAAGGPGFRGPVDAVAKL